MARISTISEQYPIFELYEVAKELKVAFIRGFCPSNHYIHYLWFNKEEPKYELLQAVYVEHPAHGLISIIRKLFFLLLIIRILM